MLLQCKYCVTDCIHFTLGSYVLHPVNDALWLSACLLMYFGASAMSIPAWCYAAQRYVSERVRVCLYVMWSGL